MQRRRLCAVLTTTAATVAAIAGCTGGGWVDGGEAAYLLLDRDARAAGFRLVVDGEAMSPVFPVELPPGQGPLALTGPDGEHRPLPIDPGRLLHIRGATGRIDSWALGTEVLSDVVQVTAAAERARTLAAALGAAAPEPLGISGPERSWRLRGSDALVRSAWMGEPPDVLEVAPELATAAAETTITAAAAGLPARPAGAGADDILALPGDRTLSDFVGIHTVAGRQVLLDAEGGWTFLDKRPCLNADGNVGTRGRTRRLGEHLLLEGAGLLIATGGAP